MPPNSRRVPGPWIGLTLLVAGVLGCASPSPDAPTNGRSTVWGHVVLVPPRGLSGSSSAGDAYGDRRLRGARLVDYSHPGFSVVYVDEGPDPDAADLDLAIRDGGGAPRIEPRTAAYRAGGAVVLTNRSDQGHLVSCPSARILQRVEPGESLRLTMSEPGAHDIHLIDTRDASARVFASPGPFVRVARSGRFELPDLRPGPALVGVWHTRFAPRRLRIELLPDAIVQLEFELGPGAQEEARIARP